MNHDGPDRLSRRGFLAGATAAVAGSSLLAGRPGVARALAPPAQQPSHEFKTGVVEANGLEFHYVEAGEGPLALCLHGFPDSPFSYRYLMPELAKAGYRAVAPFMRGYTPHRDPRQEFRHHQGPRRRCGRPAGSSRRRRRCSAHCPRLGGGGLLGRRPAGADRVAPLRDHERPAAPGLRPDRHDLPADQALVLFLVLPDEGLRPGGAGGRLRLHRRPVG